MSVSYFKLGGVIVWESFSAAAAASHDISALGSLWNTQMHFSFYCVEWHGLHNVKWHRSIHNFIKGALTLVDNRPILSASVSVSQPAITNRVGHYQSRLDCNLPPAARSQSAEAPVTLLSQGRAERLPRAEDNRIPLHYIEQYKGNTEKGLLHSATIRIFRS